jgi:PAH dioxygenase small subunit
MDAVQQRGTALDEAVRMRRNDEMFGLIEDFYVEEAALLDDNRLDEWLGTLAPDISYVMPVRTTTTRREMPGFSSTTNFFDENFGSLQTRVRRVMSSTHAWAEDPPSRTRRFVTNLRAGRLADGTFAAATNLLLVRNRGEDHLFELFSAQRNDVLRAGHANSPEPDALELVSRLILMDQASVGAVNFGLFV